MTSSLFVDRASPYAGRRLGLATRHGKEQVITRPFRHGLGLEVVLAEAFDTDSLGTFSGERPRLADAEATCQRKAEAAIAATGLELGLASEGSFGPHPAIPWLAVGMEWLTFVDRSAGLTISEHLLVHRTNFEHRLVAPGENLDRWLEQVGFPSHALIVRPHQGGSAMVCKGIRAIEALELAVVRCSQASADGLAWLETDMRAHCNPTRMASIRRLAFRLVRRIATPCPGCGAPGWGLEETIAGLPCVACGGQTELVREEVWGCGACDHRQRRPRRDGRLRADPGDCSWCNP